MAEPTTGVRFAGVLRDGSGNLITSGVTANSYDIGTTTPTRGTEDSTFTSGKFAIADSGFGRFDVKIVNGSEQIWWSSLAEVQVTSLHARNPTTASAALEVFSTTDETSSLVAVFGFRPSTESSGVETAATPANGDNGYINFELPNIASGKEQFTAARIAWEVTDVTDGSEDGQFNFWTMKDGTLREKLHLDNSALWPEADGSDASYGVSLGTATLGFNDLHLGSGGVVNFDGGDVTLTHASNALTLAGGTFTVSGATVLNGNVTLGSDADDVITVNGTVAGANAVVFEGATAGGDTNETTLAVVDPDADRTIYMPNQSGYLGVFAADTSAGTISATVGELNLTDGGSSIGTTAVSDGHGILMNHGGTMAQTTVQTLAAYLDDEITAMPNLVTVGTIGTGVWQGTAIASGYIAADAITGAKIADDALDSEHYTDGSIDTAHLAADAVTGAKIADDAIDSEHYTDGSIDTAHIADDQVTLAKMAGLTRGSMIIGDSSGNPSALVKGSANYVLTSDGTDIAWAAASSGPSQANQAAVEGETNEDTYVPPDLLRHAPGVAKASCTIPSAGNALDANSYNMAGITDTGTGDRLLEFDTDFSAITGLVCIAQPRAAFNDNDQSHCDTAAVGTVKVVHFRSGTATDAPQSFVAFGDQ